MVLLLLLFLLFLPIVFCVQGCVPFTHVPVLLDSACRGKLRKVKHVTTGASVGTTRLFLKGAEQRYESGVFLEGATSTLV